jgi:hypothetical protein
LIVDQQELTVVVNEADGLESALAFQTIRFIDLGYIVDIYENRSDIRGYKDKPLTVV